MPTTTSNKNVKKDKITTLAECYRNPRISRVLLLLDLFENGLTKECIFSLLNCPKDRGARKALKELIEVGLIEKRKIRAKPVRAINNPNFKNFERIETGLEGVGQYYIVKQNPVELLFQLIEPPKKYENLMKGKLAKDIINRYGSFVMLYGFKSKYICPVPKGYWEEYRRSLGMKLSESEKELEKIGKEKKAKKLKGGKEELLKHIIKSEQLSIQAKVKSQQEIIEILRSKEFNYEELISVYLQRIIVENFILLYTDHTLNYSPSELKQIEELIYKLTPASKPLSIIGELTSRIQNYPNLLELIKRTKKLNKWVRKVNKKREIQKKGTNN